MAKFMLNTVLTNGVVYEARYTADTYAQAISILTNLKDSSVRQVDVLGEKRDERWVLQSNGMWRELGSARTV